MFLSLFITSFVSATLWPMASEAVFLVSFHQHPDALLALVLIASAGNSLGAVLMYELGRLSHSWVERKLIGQQARLQRLEQKLQKYGAPLLFFAWLPVIGDLLPLAAGGLHLSRLPAWLWLIFGKTCRYSMLAIGAASVAG